jgi:hypothetical protein
MVNSWECMAKAVILRNRQLQGWGQPRNFLSKCGRKFSFGEVSGQFWQGLSNWVPILLEVLSPGPPRWSLKITSVAVLTPAPITLLTCCFPQHFNDSQMLSIHASQGLDQHAEGSGGRASSPWRAQPLDKLLQNRLQRSTILLWWNSIMTQLFPAQKHPGTIGSLTKHSWKFLGR